jgi:hypothetical protein
MTMASTAPPESAIPTGFVAYASKNALLAETLRHAIAALNMTRRVFLKSWEELNIGGRMLVDTICKEIDSANFFVADLTALNHNVLFELGYAIARNKRIWLLLDPTDEQGAKDWRDFSLLQTVGYRPATNSETLVANFWADAVSTTLSDTLLSASTAPSASRETGVLLLKPKNDTNLVREVEKRVRDSLLTSVIDDPAETPIQTLSWYVQEVRSASTVVCMLERDGRVGARLRNARTSLAAGLAKGFDKSLLMIVEGDFVSPLDYKDILRVVQTAGAAREQINGWLRPLEDAFEARRVSTGPHRLSPAVGLRELWIGDPVAENEEPALRDGYFVETAPYLEAVRGKTRALLFVGPKGAGKSANYVKLAGVLTSDRRNIVVAINPSYYDLTSLVRVLLAVADRDRKTFVIECLWRLLLFSELTRALCSRLESVADAARDADQQAILDFREQHPAIFEGDFAVRLERALILLNDVASSDGVDAFQREVADRINLGLIPQLRGLLAAALPRRGSVVLLADNLDKAWERSADLAALSEFLLGLVRSAHKVANELDGERHEKSSAEIRMVVFLRSDIFARLKQVAREPDKLRASILRWDDSSLLLRVVEERMRAASRSEDDAGTLWQRFFAFTVDGRPTREALLHGTLPKPRDLLYAVRASIESAVNKGHQRVEDVDIREGLKRYSEFAFEVLSIEEASTAESVADALIMLAGGPRILRLSDLTTQLSKSSPASAADQDWTAIAKRLVLQGFLEIETVPGTFQGTGNEAELARFWIMAQRTANDFGGDITVRIHQAFVPVLQVN